MTDTRDYPPIDVALLFDRSASRTHRWHNRLTLQPETIAEHQFHTAWTGFLLAEALAQRPGNPFGVDSRNVALLGLMHDQVETVTADIPHNLKRATPRLRELFREVDRYGEGAFLSRFGASQVADSVRQWITQKFDDTDSDEETALQTERELVHLADLLVAITFGLVETQLGNRYMEWVLKRTAQVVLDEYGPLPWWGPLNEEIPGLETALRHMATAPLTVTSFWPGGMLDGQTDPNGGI